MALLHEPRIQISVGSGLDETNSHGSLWIRVMREGRERIEKIFFQLDKPHCVKSGLSYGVWSQLLRQIRKMGLEPTHMELDVDNRQFCYLAERYQEIYNGVAGRHIVREGVS